MSPEQKARYYRRKNWNNIIMTYRIITKASKKKKIIIIIQWQLQNQDNKEIPKGRYISPNKTKSYW